MTRDEILTFLTGLGGVVVWTAAPGDGSPEIAWGDSFCYYSPDGSIPTTQPFATIVTKDYPDDATCRLDRPGAFRVNIAIGDDALAAVIGDEAVPEQQSDPAATDVLRRHPVYGRMGWAAVINPGPRTAAQTRHLLTLAHDHARNRHQRRHPTPL